jgi:O-antigen ligase
MVSWFLHLTARLPFLGAIRFDLVLVLLLFFLSLFRDRQSDRSSQDECKKKLNLLIVTIIVITPFAEFPGSVLNFGAINFLKAVVFFYFTVWYVNDKNKLIIFLATFVFCQYFRIIEPLYLHVTEGYWGSQASMSGWEYMNRLAGAPSDIINPNGLAYVILTVLPFIICFYRINVFCKVIAVIMTPPALYSMMLTGSRSGALGLLVMILYLFYKSENKARYVVGAVIAASLIFGAMSGVQKDRYESIYNAEARNATTVEGRLSGMTKNLHVGLRKPLFGHGLGTSLEANANYGSSAQPAHNIYIEVFQELGVVGLVIFMMYLWAVLKGLFVIPIITDTFPLSHIKTALSTLAVTTFFFGFASYGLSSYEWYLLGGCLVCINNLHKLNQAPLEIV